MWMRLEDNFGTGSLLNFLVLATYLNLFDGQDASTKNFLNRRYWMNLSKMQIPKSQVEGPNSMIFRNYWNFN